MKNVLFKFFFWVNLVLWSAEAVNAAVDGDSRQLVLSAILVAVWAVFIVVEADSTSDRDSATSGTGSKE